MKDNRCYTKLLEKFDKFDEVICDLKTKINNLIELCDNDGSDTQTQGQTNDTQTDTQQENNDE